MLLEYFTLGLSLLFKIFSLWFVATSIMFWRRPKPYQKQKPKTKFACLIPARNEEAVIGDIVKSLQLQNYPEELYDIYVIPNNCTDDTAAAAKSAGAKILNCTGTVTKKGDVLHQVFRQLIPEINYSEMSNSKFTPPFLSADIDHINSNNYDVFCIFDADNYVDSEFLSSMNNAFLSGARVAKGQLRAKNPQDSWVSGCYALYYGLFETIYNRSRAVLGLSAKLVGTGFAVSRDLIIEMGGWNTETIAEDAEFAALCAAHGARVHWVPNAITFDEAPTTFDVSLKQRHRWCSGIMDVATKKYPSLVKAIFKTKTYHVPIPATAETRNDIAPYVLERNPLQARRTRTIDMLFFLAGPYFQALSLLPFFMGMMCHLFGATATFLLTAPISLVASCMGITLLAIFITTRIKERIPLMAKAIIMFPIFMASWMPLQMLSLVHRADRWHEIRHYGYGAKANA